MPGETDREAVAWSEPHIVHPANRISDAKFAGEAERFREWLLRWTRD
jgi:hypothetical protein